MSDGAIKNDSWAWFTWKHGSNSAMTFREMLTTVLDEMELSLTKAAPQIGISIAYLHDLKSGRRLPSVDVTNKICDWLSRGPAGRAEWHRAGAKAHGWNIP